MFKMLFRCSKGHIITELPLTMLLISSLSAAAMPQYANMVEKARSAEALVALTQTRQAMFFYFQEHDGYNGASLDKLYFDPNNGYDPATGLNLMGARQHFEYQLTQTGLRNFMITAKRNAYWGGGEFQGASVSVDQQGVITKTGVYA